MAPSSSKGYETCPMFDLRIVKRGRRCKWQVAEVGGAILMKGWAASRLDARYQAYRALFLLLQGSPLKDKERLRGEL
jgi:hypothetical protein